MHNTAWRANIGRDNTTTPFLRQSTIHTTGIEEGSVWRLR